MSYYKHHVFFCCNQREPGETCCNAHGASALQAYAKDRIGQLKMKGQGKVRINYQTHGDPLYVLVWQDGASTGLLLGRPVQASGPMRMAEVPVARLQAFERQSMASEAELEQLLG